MSVCGMKHHMKKSLNLDNIIYFGKNVVLDGGSGIALPESAKILKVGSAFLRSVGDSEEMDNAIGKRLGLRGSRRPQSDRVQPKSERRTRRTKPQRTIHLS